MFVDKVKIKIKSGNGGKGHCSFLTAKYVPNGGPNGGDGGKGGDIIFEAAENMNTLIDYYYVKHFKAADGARGDINNMTGRGGTDTVLRVPCGTLVKDAESGKVIADMFEAGYRKVVLKGGRGGLGNAHFASSRRQAPNFSQSGEQTLEREVVLELKTIADVGLVGFPNVGKSTLLSVVSAARPKIANYHFTTLSPNLGAVKYYDDSFVVADIPGLIEGASEGQGLGLEFLRHVERTRLIVHVIDISGCEGREPYDDYLKINAELKKFSPELARRPQLIALNKADLLPEGSTAAEDFKKKLKGKKVFLISGVARSGLKELIDEIYKQLQKLPKLAAIETDGFEYASADYDSFEITKEDGVFVITGGLVDRISRNVRFDDMDSMAYFHKTLKERGVIDQLYAMGAQEGDTVRMKDLEFEFLE